MGGPPGPRGTPSSRSSSILHNPGRRQRDGAFGFLGALLGLLAGLFYAEFWGFVGGFGSNFGFITGTLSSGTGVNGTGGGRVVQLGAKITF